VIISLLLALTSGFYLLFFWAAPSTPSTQREVVHPLIEHGQYVFDKRTDICYYVTTIAGSTDFVSVPCTDKVMAIAAGGI
jgi:hypothetical protein